MDALGLGWRISLPTRDHPLMLIKTGSMPGFMSYVALAPTHGVGLFVAFDRYQLGALDGVVDQSGRSQFGTLLSRFRRFRSQHGHEY